MYVYTDTRICYTCIHRHVCLRVYIAYLSLYIYISIYTRMYIHIVCLREPYPASTYIYICMHTHTHVQTLLPVAGWADEHCRVSILSVFTWCVHIVHACWRTCAQMDMQFVLYEESTAVNCHIIGGLSSFIHVSLRTGMHACIYSMVFAVLLRTWGAVQPLRSPWSRCTAPTSPTRWSGLGVYGLQAFGCLGQVLNSWVFGRWRLSCFRRASSVESSLVRTKDYDTPNTAWQKLTNDWSIQQCRFWSPCNRTACAYFDKACTVGMVRADVHLLTHAHKPNVLNLESVTS